MSRSNHNSPEKDEALWVKIRALMLSFIRMYLSFPDRGEASKQVGEQAKLHWEKSFAAELERLELDAKAIESSFAKSSKILSSLLDKLRCTKPYIHAAHLYGDEGHKTIDFSQWRAKDKVIVVFSMSAALVVLAMGAMNVYANIIGSGNPVFIENPILAFIISMLLPIGSVSMKFVTDIFETDKAKAIYIKTLYIFTVLALLTWTVLFALIFHGLSAEIIFDDIGQSNPAAPALTWIQLLAELLVGFVLCQVASDTYAKYAPNAYIRNPEYTEIESALKEHSKSHEVLREERNALKGRLVEVKSSCQLFINEMVALFLSMRRRFDDSSPA